MSEIADFISKLLDTADWPPRWHCGKWTSFHGWLFIISDLLVWSAYFTIPAIIIRYITIKKHQRFIRLYFLFAAFIMACGATHFLDAVSFWYPAYRLNALVRLITAIISWVTIFYMIKLLPYYFSLKTPAALEAEAAMRQKAEQELQLKNEQLRNAETIGQFGHFEWDLANGTLKMSEGMRQLFDLPETQEITTLAEYLKFVPDTERIQQHSLLETFINNRHFRTHYQNIVTAKGHKKIFLTRGSVICNNSNEVVKIIGTSQDITEFKKNKQLLEESRRIFKNAFDYSSIGMALVDIQGRWINVNQSICDMFGYTREEMLQRTFMDMTHPDDIAEDMGYVKQLLNHEIDNYRMEKRFFRKDGSIIWILLSASLVWKDNQPAFFTSQLVDISPNKHLLNEMENKNLALEKANHNLQYHIEHITEFNRIISHNLRGPATTLISAVDFVADCEEEETAELLTSIKGTSELIIQTLNDLKEVIEVQLNRNVTFSSCPLQQIIDHCTQKLQEAIQESNATITTQLDIPDIQFPRVYLESVFYNLLSNAIRFRQEGRPLIIHITSEKKDDKTFISVADNGTGIDLNRYKEDVFKYKRIFHKGHNGRGLGLFLVKNQVEACGGKIKIASDGISGTTFTIAL